MAFGGNYAISNRRAHPVITIGIEDAAQAENLIRLFRKTGRSTPHMLEVAARASKSILENEDTGVIWDKQTAIRSIAKTVAATNDPSVIFSIHYDIGKQEELADELPRPVEEVSKSMVWEQLYAVVQKTQLSIIFENSRAKYGIRANRMDEDIVTRLGQMEGYFPRIYTGVETQRADGAEFLRSATGLEYLIINLPQEEGRGFDAQASVSAANMFVAQRGYLTIGFVGGFTPENVRDRIMEIASLAGTIEFSVGFESGVRTDGRFDEEKAKRAVTASISAFEEQDALLRRKEIRPRS